MRNPAARITGIATGGLVGLCVLFSGCATSGSTAAGGTSATGPASASPGGSASSPAIAVGGAAKPVKLTGNFCTDLVAIESSVPHVPASQANLTVLRQAAAQALNTGADHFAELEAEGPPTVAADIRTIVSAFRTAAQAIASATTQAQVNQAFVKAQSSGHAGAAFRGLVVYVVSKCG